MPRFIKCLFLFLLIFPVTFYTISHHAFAAHDTIMDALKNGTPYLTANYRYEFVKQKGIEHNANASTLGASFGYKTAEFKNFSALLAFQTVSEIGERRYNDTSNSGRENYATVADPKGDGIDKVFLKYAEKISKTDFILGRQDIQLDNQRFLGSESWRQNGLSFDGVGVNNSYLDNFLFSYYFISGINWAFADSNGLSTYKDNNINLFHISYQIPQYGKISAYNYLIDMVSAPSLSSKTVGIRADMSYKFDDVLTAFYELEYAHQEDYADNVNNYNANYFLFSPGITYKNFTALFGYEILGSDRVASFQTPLASRHNFNGFADKFLTTPINGLVDSYITVKYKINSDNNLLNDIQTLFTFHDFSSYKAVIDYGQEYDFIIEKAIGQHYNIGAKAAYYKADSTSTTDTVKIMVFSGLQF